MDSDAIGAGGDPTGEGKGGQSIYGAPFNDEFVDSLKHSDRGIGACFNHFHCCMKGHQSDMKLQVSMANRGPNTNGSQFFIIYKASEQLDSKYTVFEKVLSLLGQPSKSAKSGWMINLLQPLFPL